MQPLVTVYIPCHNHENYIASAIESVLTQTFDDWELIIFNDGSSDNSDEVIRLYESHPKIRFIKTSGIGLPKVCNYALAEASGSYLIRLDGDDIFDENILLVLANYLEKNIEMAFVFPDYYLIDQFGEEYLQEKRELLFEDNNMIDMPPHGACTLIRTSVLRENGGYREDLGVQDGLDLWTRLKDSYQYGNVNLPLFYYRRHQDNLTGNQQRIFAARQTIKRSAIEGHIPKNRPIIAVIPCREHFDFRRNLWSVSINGNSLLDLAINSCLSCDLIDLVVVTCDNNAVENVVKERADNRLKWLKRETDTTIRNSKLTPILQRIVKTYDPERQGLLVTRFIQSPFVSEKSVEEALSTLILNDATSSIGVVPLKSDIYKRKSYGMNKLNKSTKVLSDFDMFYLDPGTVKVTKSSVISKGSVLGAAPVCFEISENESCFINSEQDLLIADQISISINENESR